jgi:signal transduction histidine kinase/CheY-like chemotaxis protein
MADWCAVHLEGESVEDSTIANVDPAKVEMLREIYRHHLFAKGTVRGHRRVMESGEPAFVSEITPDFWASVAESPEQLKLFETVGTISWIIVPLNVQGHVFGALTLAYSESGRHYTQTDFALASELARRAAVAIDNARLYELSQSERSRVEATTRAKDEFVAMISHELRTPLNAILGWLRLMRAGGLPESKREHAFDVIERNAQAQNQLVADLLDISRIITGKIRINPSQMDLANVVEMAIEGVRPAADAKRIELQVAIDDGAAVMRGDGDRLQQVVWNLLANAVKFTPKNGVVRVHVRRVDSDFELTVTDTGPGIDAAFLPYVFESFRQAESGTARPHGGLGIGLSIVKHLVELHGGSVEAESKGAGQGTTFRVLLPISPLVSTTMGISRVAATEPQGAAAPLRGGLEGVRVLVVDDEPDARELITFVLENAGAAVRVAESARDALQAVSTFAPQVIVSDIGMPLEDGYSLVRSIRTLPAEELRNVPAIALTAFARNEDRTRALTAGFNLHMTKPVEPSALVSAVAELAGRTLR